jgi:hypothetical protein
MLSDLNVAIDPAFVIMEILALSQSTL